MADARDETGKQAPSLIEQVRRRRFRVPERLMPALRIALLVLVAVLALVMIVAGIAGRRARREALALGDTVARVSAAREADRAAAVLFARPGVVDELATLAAHLPPDTKLARAARDREGILSFAIDSADPDALRQTLKSDRWFAGFHERGQTMGEEGVIRVTFERANAAEGGR